MAEKKIKLLFVTEGLGNGGKEREIIEFLKNINKDLFYRAILSFNNHDFFKDEAIKYSDEYFEFYKNKEKYKIFYKIFNIFRYYKPDYIINYDLLSSIYTFLPSLIHRFKIADASIQDTGLDTGWHKILKKFFLKRANLVISNTNKGLEVYNIRGEVIYNIVNTQRFTIKREHIGFNIAKVANFSDYKDYDTYLELAVRLTEKNIVSKAYAVGSGKKLDYYKQKYKKYTNIIFTGAINNVESFLSEIDAGFLFSTEKYGEGLSNSLLEYLASDTIAFATDIGASNEIIVDGVNGFLINKNKLEDITEIIIRIKSGVIDKEKIIMNARDTITGKFSLKDNIKKFESLFM